MNIFAVSPIEGSFWIPWGEWQRLRVPGSEGKRVHAIMFDDGRVWDASNGFRSEEFWIGKYDRGAILETWEEVLRLMAEPTARQRMLVEDARRLEKVIGSLA